MTIKCKDANPRKCTRVCPLYKGFFCSAEVGKKLDKVCCIEQANKVVELEKVP